jgi:predicted nicotinamide N-methyase
MTSTNLTNRLTPETSDSTPEDFLSSSLAVIFPDAVANQHGDAHTALLYTSPLLPKPLRIQLADPPAEDERQLFGHYLWNASLLAAEFIEAGTVDVSSSTEQRGSAAALTRALEEGIFNVRDKRVVELGAGTALPSMMAALLGAKSVTVTEYPSDALLATLRGNVERNVRRENGPKGGEAGFCEDVVVSGHAWGETTDEFAAGRKHGFDVVIAADCLVGFFFSIHPFFSSLRVYLPPLVLS